ncbi:glutathione S-transferase family protein [Aestuariirhabdus litorea]|uniref:Glutathione S-transferase n=1 Tax=Aestuariirhabdus litorea TaxID=2528527 RepID=A0A3P3VLK5_9GAMM|nr:glutathione S-transferase [Aestuariirhabdus litorea]RRJ83615.1 glutathione S-transferase [Aestuariirhabdus litorea]RWW96836.1 glutathione S-transferase [Endozoicomonadaceae bacterium GTF-13]
MLKLYGFNVSNYYNMVKQALLEKGVPFEEIKVYPNQEESYLEISPMGKVPCLLTEQGPLTETSVILDYLEESQPGEPLYPAQAYARAKVRELIHELVLYIELPARRCFGEVFFGGTTSAETKAEVEATLLKGVSALRRRSQFSPFIAGESFSYADIVFLHSFDLANQVAERLFQRNLFDELPGAQALMARLAERPMSQRVAVEMRAGMEEFVQLRSAKP